MEIAESRAELVKSLLTELSFPDAHVDVGEVDGGIAVTIHVDESDSGVLIGYHGEKIDSLQLVINLMFNQNNLVYTPVQVDINGYRDRRKKNLEELADKAAGKAIESGREILLPHLPSYERRIIHMYLQNSTDVTTYSEGENEDRRLVVRPSTSQTE
jgi:spoIIIJ-associated protein